MSISVPIDQLINENIVEWARIEFKEEWDPNSTLKTISAFANNIDNWGNGYIVFLLNLIRRYSNTDQVKVTLYVKLILS